MNFFDNKYLRHIMAVTILLIVSVIYFYPETQGKKILSHDQISSVAAAKEVHDYEKKRRKNIMDKSNIFRNASFSSCLCCKL